MIILFSGCVRKSQQSQFEVRALWVDPPGFKDKETVDGLIEKCRKAGINTIIPDIMLRENVWFKSVNFAGKVNADDQFDPLEYLIKKAHADGIKVQAWSCVYHSIAKYPEWNSKPFASDNYNGGFLSAAHPDVNPYLLSVLRELLNYDIDGIHLDYTRYWNAAFDYSDAACNRFRASHGFNPKDFLDHPERIVPPDKDVYPVRVLCPLKMAEWEMGSVERNLNRTEIGYAYLSEQTANIDALKTPGLLIVSYYHQVPADMINALERFVNRGGDIVWMDPTSDLFNKQEFNALTGITGARYFGLDRMKFRTLDDHPFGKLFDTLQVKIDGNLLTEGEAEVIACTDSGEPVIRILQKGKGHVMTVGLGVMDSGSQEIIQLLIDIITGFKTQAGITGPDLMAEKRKLWIDWRASFPLDLVCELNKMIKEKNPDLLLTAAAGVGPQEYYSIYRDGRDWLIENIVDYIFPMNYTEEIDDLQDILDEQLFHTPDDMSDRIYPGLQLYTFRNNNAASIDASIVDEQIGLIKQYGYRGFCLFAYSYFSDEIIEVVKKYSQ
jgi:uncharacterized lipoprotein YddW (UPF0748 family)